MFHQVRHGYFDFPSPEWDNISVQAKDFITQLLQKDPAARMSATQSINHAWFDTPSGGAIADATAAAAAGGVADATSGGDQVCMCFLCVRVEGREAEGRGDARVVLVGAPGQV